MFGKNVVSITVCDNRPIIGRFKRARYARLFGQKMSELAGGASIVNGQGLWNSDKNGLISENNLVVFTYCDNPDQIYQELLPIIGQYLSDCKQDCAFVLIDGRPEVLSQEDLKEVIR